MLSLRLAIFAALFGIALWGLFSLLGNLREPQLLRTDKSIVVKGCEPMESAQAQALCPQLFCQKFLLEGRRVPLRSVFKVTVDTSAGNQHLIGGVVQTGGSADSDRRFACTRARCVRTSVFTSSHDTVRSRESSIRRRISASGMSSERQWRTKFSRSRCSGP